MFSADMTEAVAKFVKELLLVDAFYDSIGGVAGYQLKCLEMMLGSKKESSSEQSSAEASSSAEEETKFYMPQGLNIAYNRRAAAAAAAVASPGPDEESATGVSSRVQAETNTRAAHDTRREAGERRIDHWDRIGVRAPCGNQRL